MNLHLDTHVALWMVAGEKRRLRPAQALLARATLFVSPFVAVEIEILHEIGRLRAPAATIVDILREDHGVAEARGDLGEIAGRARHLGWTRDPFDRLIVAHALSVGAALVTANESIRKHCAQSRWNS